MEDETSQIETKIFSKPGFIPSLRVGDIVCVNLVNNNKFAVARGEVLVIGNCAEVEGINKVFEVAERKDGFLKMNGKICGEKLNDQSNAVVDIGIEIFSAIKKHCKCIKDKKFIENDKCTNLDELKLNYENMNYSKKSKFNMQNNTEAAVFGYDNIINNTESRTNACNLSVDLNSTTIGENSVKHSSLLETNVKDNDISSNNIPNNDISSNLIPNNDISSNNIPNNDISSNVIPKNDISSNLISKNDISSNLIPNNDISSNVIPNNDISSNVIPNNAEKKFYNDESNLFHLVLNRLLDLISYFYTKIEKLKITELKNIEENKFFTFVGFLQNKIKDHNKLTILQLMDYTQKEIDGKIIDHLYVKVWGYRASDAFMLEVGKIYYIKNIKVNSGDLSRKIEANMSESFNASFIEMDEKHILTFKLYKNKRNKNSFNLDNKNNTFYLHNSNNNDLFNYDNRNNRYSFNLDNNKNTIYLDNRNNDNSFNLHNRNNDDSFNLDNINNFGNNCKYPNLTLKEIFKIKKIGIYCVKVKIKAVHNFTKYENDNLTICNCVFDKIYKKDKINVNDLLTTKNNLYVENKTDNYNSKIFLDSNENMNSEFRDKIITKNKTEKYINFEKLKNTITEKNFVNNSLSNKKEGIENNKKEEIENLLIKYFKSPNNQKKEILNNIYKIIELNKLNKCKYKSNERKIIMVSILSESFTEALIYMIENIYDKDLFNFLIRNEVFVNCLILYDNVNGRTILTMLKILEL
ncbi:hypothetical protein COBT_001941 [Conglomerata obtusa]